MKQNKIIELIKEHSAETVTDRYMISAFDLPELRNFSENKLKMIASQLDKPLDILDAFSEFEIPAFMTIGKKYNFTDKENSERKYNPEKFWLSGIYIENNNIEKRKTYNTTVKGKRGMLDIYDNGKEKFIEFLEST